MTDEELQRLFIAASECIDCIEIATLADSVIDGKIAKLQEVRKGSAFTSAQTNEDQDSGRDIAFELLVAAALQRTGAIVKLEAPADVTADVPGARFYVECKRPRSTAGFARSLQRASKQIARIRLDDIDGIAVVAVDLTRVLNPSMTAFIEDDADAAMEQLHGLVRKYLFTHRSQIDRYRNDFHRAAAIDAMLIRMTAIFRTKHAVETTTAVQIYSQAGGDQRKLARARLFFDFYERSGADRLFPSKFASVDAVSN